jgi:predicted TPR repeat methyltransferase
MRTAADFDRLYADPDPWRISRAKLRDRVLRRCVSRFVAGKSVLELGCGEGHLTRAIFSEASHVTGVDVSGVAIDRARSLKIRNAVFHHSDFLSISFEGYDVIVAIECLYYLAPSEQLQFFEKLRTEHRGKIVIISAPIIGENQHRRYFTHDEIVATFERLGVNLIEHRNINVYRQTAHAHPAVANLAAAIVRLPFGHLLLDRIPDRLIYQRCYIGQA